MAKDARALREEAAEATSAGKYKRALAAYLELERMEPRDAQWAKRAGETYKRLGNNKLAIEAFERSAERYAQNGFLVQAIAVCKLVLQIDPQHADTLRRLATMSDQVGAGPTRAGGMAENNPALYDNANVAVLRRARNETDPHGVSSGIPKPVGGSDSRPIETFSRPNSAHDSVPVAIPDGRTAYSQPIAAPPMTRPLPRAESIGGGTALGGTRNVPVVPAGTQRVPTNANGVPIAPTTRMPLTPGAPPLRPPTAPAGVPVMPTSRVPVTPPPPPPAPVVQRSAPIAVFKQTEPGTYSLDDPDEDDSDGPLDLSDDLGAAAGHDVTQPMDPMDLPPVEAPRNVVAQQRQPIASIARITPVSVPASSARPGTSPAAGQATRAATVGGAVPVTSTQRAPIYDDDNDAPTGHSRVGNGPHRPPTGAAPVVPVAGTPVGRVAVARPPSASEAQRAPIVDEDIDAPTHQARVPGTAANRAKTVGGPDESGPDTTPREREGAPPRPRVATPAGGTQPMPTLSRAPAIPPGTAPVARAPGLPSLGKPPAFASTPPPRLGPTPNAPVLPAPSLRPKSTTPAPQLPRTKSRPISLPEGASLTEIDLNKQVENSRRREDSVAGVHVIPIGDEVDIDLSMDLDARAHSPVSSAEIDLEIIPPSRPSLLVSTPSGSIDIDTGSSVALEIEAPDDSYEAEPEEPTELEIDDIEEIGMAQPKAIGAAAQRALAATPLFAGLPSDALASLVGELALVNLTAGDVLFREGDAADALYVIAEGELAVQNEGPPRVELARLGPGQFIGEIALMTDQPRSATVTALVDAELLRIDRPTLSRVLGEHGDVLRAVLRFVRDRLVDRWIRTSPLFRPFDPESRAELAARFSFLEIDAGTTLIGKGARPDGLYIVLAGKFHVVRDGAVVIALGPGDLIGEVALLSGGAFRSDVIAMGKSLALCLPAPVFREVIMTHPHVLEYIGEHAESSRRLQIL